MRRAKAEHAGRVHRPLSWVGLVGNKGETVGVRKRASGTEADAQMREDSAGVHGDRKSVV